MVSSSLLGKVHLRCQTIMDNLDDFGGLHVILCGDFLQVRIHVHEYTNLT